MENLDDVLLHFGVKGMKWGVRKDKDVTSRSKTPKEKLYHIPDKKSAHRVRLEANYLKKGFADDKAEQLAARRIKAEKIVAATLLTATAAAATYVGYQEIGKR